MTSSSHNPTNLAGIGGSAAAVRRAPLWLGATIFLLAYVAVSPVQGALSDRAAPLPDDPAAELAAYAGANPGAILAGAALQVLSVLGFMLFVQTVLPVLRATSPTTARRLQVVGLLSVAAMLLSSTLAAVTAAIAAPDAAETVATLRAAGFYAGGVANVALLGAFVFGAARLLARVEDIGGVTKWFGYVAGTLAMLSVLSLAIYYANAFLPIGRVLSMVWTVLAAVVIVRRTTSPVGHG